MTPKQQSFVREYLVDRNATQAAIRAGYSAKTANQQGPRLLVDVGILEALKNGLGKLQQQAQVKHEVTIDSLIREAEEARAKAMAEKGGSAAAVAALTAKAKLAGLWVERQQGENLNVNYDLTDELPPDQWERERTTAN